MTAYEVLLAWAKSPGFAAIHNGAATDEQIVDDLLLWLARNDAEIIMGARAVGSGLVRWTTNDGTTLMLSQYTDPNQEFYFRDRHWTRA